jgi:hypothetical protein
VGQNRLISATETSSGTVVDQVNVSYDVFGNRVEEDKTQNGQTTVTKRWRMMQMECAMLTYPALAAS